MPRVSSLYLMASAGTEERGCTRTRLPAEAADGNPGEYSGESPEGVETRQEDPGMPKTAAITSPLNLSQFVAGQRHHTIRQPHCLKRCP